MWDQFVDTSTLYSEIYPRRTPRRFGEDSIRDAIDILSVSNEFSNDPNFRFDDVRLDLIDRASESGIDDGTKRFTDVREAAKLLGLSNRQFRDMNRLLLKFAHPTDLRVIQSSRIRN
jgi:hypothetical protein